MPTYRVTGAMRETGDDVVADFEAADEGMAEKIAARQMLVSRVERVGASGMTVGEELRAAEKHARAQAEQEEAARVEADRARWQATAPVGSLRSAMIGGRGAGDRPPPGMTYTPLRWVGIIAIGSALGVAAGLFLFIIVWIFLIVGLSSVGETRREMLERAEREAERAAEAAGVREPEPLRVVRPGG